MQRKSVDDAFTKVKKNYIVDRCNTKIKERKKVSEE
jgi:hypothetical protein